MPKEPLRITDHAVIRYMERAMGLNVEIVREHIASICAGPAAVGAVCVRTENVRFEIVNNTVTTVTPDRANPSKTSLERNQRTIERTERDRIESNRRNPQHRPLRSPRACTISGTHTFTVDLSVGDPGPAGFPAGTFSDAAADEVLGGAGPV